MLKKLFGFKSKEEKEDEEIHRINDAIDILEIFEQQLGLRVPGYNTKREVIMKDKFQELTKGDIAEAAHILMDLHDALEVEMDYLPLEVYEKFDTVQDILDYFLARYNYYERLKENGNA